MAGAKGDPKRERWSRDEVDALHGEQHLLAQELELVSAFDKNL